MASLKIFWTETAVKQRNHVFEYWNKRNKSNLYSISLNNKIKERIGLLKNSPELGKKTDFNITRAMSLGHYIILYKRIDFRIIITGFWDNRQDPKKLSELLKKSKNNFS